MPIVNVSMSGALLRTSGELAIGTHLDLALELDTRDVVHVKADVVRVQMPSWQHVGGVGVRFTHMDATSRETLEAFVGPEIELPPAPSPFVEATH